MLEYHIKANYFILGEKNVYLISHLGFHIGSMDNWRGRKKIIKANFCCKKHNTNDLQCFIHIQYFPDYILIICFDFRI